MANAAVLRIALLAGAAATAVPACARADDAPAARIVVTAPVSGDSISLTDTPVNGQVLSGDPLTRQDHANLADLLDAGLGSVTLSNGTGSPYQSDVSYRGFQATSLLGSPTGLSVWLDGVRMNEPFGSTVNWDLIPLNAIGTIEVMPGSNPLFGLNTLGGALVLATKNGADNGGLGVIVQGGSFARANAQVEAGGTLANRTIDWFVAGNQDVQDGYRWYTHTRVSQAYGKLRWQGIASQAELGVIAADSTLNGTQGLPLSMLGMPRRAYTWPDTVSNTQLVINLKAETHLAPALKLGGNVYYRRSNSHSANSNASLGDACESGAIDCSALAPGGTARDLDTDSLFPAGKSYTGALPIHDYTSGINTTLVLSVVRQNTWGGTVLLDLGSPRGPLGSDFNLGGSFETSSIRYVQNTDLAYLVNYQTVPMPWNFLYGSDTGFRGSPLINRVAITSHSTSFNVFARDRVLLTPKLTLSAALSYTFTHLSLSGTNTTWLDPAGNATWTGNDGNTYYNPAYTGAQSWETANGAFATVTAADGDIAGPEVQPVTGAHTYHRLNPSIGLAWNPRAELGFFANASEAMRAPTAIELACADPTTPCSLPTGFNGDPALKAVVAHSLELGARGTYAGRFAWNAAVYRTLVDNDIQFIYAPSGLGYFANLGRTARKGFELGLDADLEQVHLAASYGHVAATYRASFIDAAGDTVAPGSHITGVPGQSFKLRSTFQPTRAVVLGANLIMVSHQYAHGDEANAGVAVPGYTLVNVDIHVTPLRHVELFGTVTNLFGVHYATFAVMGGNIFNGTEEQFRTPAQGRAFMGGVRYSFGRPRLSVDHANPGE
ncbi:TonB-dependent receptor [Novosphingobium sp.]|uniref:TonB-dependent receptor n=1 Tax=Novosphingobium sp. TaxID=1874826 RepID=UPI003B52ADDC